MTELLETKTDIFAAAIPPAGLSSLHNSWSEGWWGYPYSKRGRHGRARERERERATAPGAALSAEPAEPVELIKVDGQHHWILNYPQRSAWKGTISAYFDRQL